MYTILINNDDSLTVSTPNNRIMQRSKLFDNFHFLASPTYKDQDISDCVVLMEYRRPVSKEYKTEYLTLSENLYKDRLEYKLPIDTCFTLEPGDLEIQLTFYRILLDENNNVKHQVRKTSPCSVHITPIANWSSTIPDEALTALDQRVLALMSANQDLSELQQAYLNEKADDISYEDNKISLMANGHKIGTEHTISSENDVVDFSVKESDNEDDVNNFDVIEF